MITLPVTKDILSHKIICLDFGGSATMRVIAMQEKLKQAISQREKSRTVDTEQVPAAVLVPLYYKQGQYYILFTKRTDTVREHKGQISFPGGAREKKDKTLFDTALREAAEEIGLEAGAVELLGELDAFPTIDSGYVISPFVAAIPWPYRFKIDPKEVERIIEVPISALLDKDCWYQETATIDGKVVTESSYHYRGDVIWGATARILEQFLDIWVRAMPTVEG